MKAGAKKAFVRTTGAVALGASSMSLAFPALAFASEEESGGISAILPNMTEFIPMLVCFIILVVVLGKLGRPKFAGMLEKRERTIKESLEKSEAARIESERLLERIQASARRGEVAEAAQIVADAKKTGEAVKADDDREGAGRIRRHDREGARGHRGREEGRHLRACRVR